MKLIVEANNRQYNQKVLHILRLQPIRSNESGLGASERNKTIFRHGLLGLISRNETIAIPKVETYSSRLLATDFTMPLWKNRYV